MPFYRLKYEGYIEDEFEDEDEALDVFVRELHDVDETDRNILIEVWDGEEWETI